MEEEESLARMALASLLPNLTLRERGIILRLQKFLQTRHEPSGGFTLEEIAKIVLRKTDPSSLLELQKQLGKLRLHGFLVYTEEDKWKTIGKVYFID